MPVAEKAKASGELAIPAKKTKQEIVQAMHEGKNKLADYGGNEKFQAWLKTAQPIKLQLGTGKDKLWEMLEEISACGLSVSIAAYEQYFCFLITGVPKPMVKAWIREFALVKRMKRSYVEYLQEKLDSAGIDYVDADTFKAGLA